MNWFNRMMEWLKETLSHIMMLPPRLPTMVVHSTEVKDPVAAQSSDLDLSSMKVPELKALAKERGIKGYYKLKKADLLDILNNE